MVDLVRRPDENERKIVGGHLDHLAQAEPMRRGFADEIIDVADAPARVAPLQSALKAALDGAV